MGSNLSKMLAIGVVDALPSNRATNALPMTGQTSLDVILSEALLIVFMVPTNALPSLIVSFLRVLKVVGLIWPMYLFVQYRFFRFRELVPLWLFMGSWALSSLINLHGFRIFVGLTYQTFAVAVLTKYLLSRRGMHTVFYIVTVFAVFLVIQAVTAPRGGFGISGIGATSYTNYFFGMRVAISDIYLYAIILCLLTYVYGNRIVRTFSILGILSGGFFIFFERVSTAIGATVITVAAYISSRIFRGRRLQITIGVSAVAIAIAYNFAIENSSLSEIFTWFVTEFLGESVTLNRRTLLWAQALHLMRGWKWVYGYGFDSGNLFYLGTNWMNQWSVNTAHSQYLNIVFCFGIIGLITYVIMLLQQFVAAVRVPNTRVRSLLVGGLIGLVFTGVVTTTYTAVYMYVFHVILLVLPDILPDGGDLTNRRLLVRTKRRPNRE